MRRSLASFVALITILVPAIAANATPTALPPSWSPDAAWSTDGDFATDVYGDPWDFSNDDDVIPTLEVGVQAAAGIARLPSGQLSVDTVDGTTSGSCSTGRTSSRGVATDGTSRSTATATHGSASRRTAPPHWPAAVRFQTASGAQGVLPFTMQAGLERLRVQPERPRQLPGRLPGWTMDRADRQPRAAPGRRARRRQHAARLGPVAPARYAGHPAGRRFDAAARGAEPQRRRRRGLCHRCPRQPVGHGRPG